VSEENKALVARLYEEISKGNLDALDTALDDSVVEHEELPPGIPPGKEGVKVFFGVVLSAFPDLTMTPNFMIAEGDLVTAFTTATGTHRGEFMGIPATGKTVTINLADYMRFRNGKVVEHWGVMDMASMMQQLGVGAP
jgi:steroid delta-isomerase-like uncharacterized protein